jgi:hypothetical protein
MVEITAIEVHDLYSGNEQQFLQELTFGEMAEIRGGLGEADAGLIDPKLLSELLKAMDGSWDKSATRIDEKIADMRHIFGD